MSLSIAALIIATVLGVGGLYARNLADVHYAKAVTFGDSIVGGQEATTARRYHATAAVLFVAAIVIGATSIVLRLAVAL